MTFQRTRQSTSKAWDLAVLGDQADAGGDCVRGAPRPVAHPGEPHLAFRAGTRAHDDMQETAAARAHQPGDADNLARAQRRGPAARGPPLRTALPRTQIVHHLEGRRCSPVSFNSLPTMSRTRRSSVASAGVRSDTRTPVTEHDDPVGDRRAPHCSRWPTKITIPPRLAWPTRELEHAVRFRRAERSGRLIEDQYERFSAERLGDLHQLALCHGERVDPSTRLDVEADFSQHLLGGGVYCTPVNEKAAFAQSPAEKEVLRDTQLADERELLGHHGYAEFLCLQRAASAEQPARDRNRAGIRPDRAGDHPHHRRFAGTVLADQAYDFVPCA